MRFLILIFPFLLSGQIPADAKHVYAGLGITSLVGGVTYKCTDKWLVSMGAGLGAGVLAGFAKEYAWDRRMKRGTFSKNDIMCTSWGAMLGTVCLVVSFDLEEKKNRKRIKKLYNLE